MSENYEARYWQSLPDNVIECQLCPHHCRVKPGQNGRCRARKNIDGRLIAWNYGKVTSLSLDPIEKKPLNRFFPGSQILSAGSFGCNLHCDFCQNWTIAQQEAPYRLILPVELAEMARQMVGEGNIGLAYTYNEPLVGFEFVMDCARLIHKAGLKNVLVTNGYIESEPLTEILPWIDALNIDLKAWGNDFYKSVCGGDATAVRQTISRVAAVCHVEITTLLLPGMNDNEEDIRALAGWLASINPAIPLHLNRHHPDFRMTKPAPISRQRLHYLAELAKIDLEDVMTGNI